MDADLDLLLTTVFVTVGDLLPGRQNNASKSVTDAEVVTLCVAQAIMGIQSDCVKRLRSLTPSTTAIAPVIPGFWGFRLHAIFALDRPPGALELTSLKIDERDVSLVLLQRLPPSRAERRSWATTATPGVASPVRSGQRSATIVRPRRKDEPGHGRSRADPPTHRVDLLGVERPAHPRTPPRPTPAGLRERVLARFCCHAAITLNHQLTRPRRALIHCKLLGDAAGSHRLLSQRGSIPAHIPRVAGHSAA
jgi:hypothetical protein